MADILASVSVVLGAEISGFRAAMADARKELRGLVQFSEGLKDIGSSLTQYVSAPLALLGGASVAASAKLESLKNGLAAIAQQDLAKQGVTGLLAMRQAAVDAGERVQALQVIAKAPGLGLETAEQADIRLRAVGTSAEQSAKEIKAFANAIATTGGGRTQFETVTTQLSQLTAKGKVLAQDLRPIIEAAPAVAAALQKLYGTVDSETISASLAKQGKNSADFVATLTDELAKLPQVTGGLKAIYENDLDALLVAGAKFGDGIAEAFNLKEVGQRFGDFVTKLGDGFASLSPGVKTLVVALGGIAAATGPVLVAVGTLGAALPAITAGFEVLGVSSLAALGPILPAAAAVAAAAYLIIDNWGAITAYFQSSEVTGLFNDLAAAAKSAVNAISEAFSTIRANVGGNLGQMVSAATIFRTVFREAVVGVTAVLDVLAGSVKTITSLLTGEWSQAWQGATQVAEGLISPLANLFGFSKKEPTDSALYVLSQQAKEFSAVGPQLAANLALLNGVRLDAVASQAAEAAKQIGLLKKLEDELKAAKDAKPNLTNEADIAASNQLIASLEAQIKRLNELGIASKEMQKAYADVQKSLRTVAQESLALGDQYDYLKNRQSATEAGIKKLIGAGFSPASTAVRALVADLRNLNSTLGDNTLLSGRVADVVQKAFAVPEFKLKLPKIEVPETVAKLDLKFDDTEAPALPDFTTIFSKAAQQVTAGGAGLDAAFQTTLTPVSQRLLDFNTNIEATFEQLGASVAPLLADFAAQAADAFGSIVTGAASFGDAMQGLFGGILQALGGFMSDFGKQLVAIGIGKLALDSLFSGPQGGPLAIAAGLGLIALAGVVSAVGKSAASSLSSIGSGGSVSTSPASRPSSFTPTVAPNATAAAPVTYTHYVEITASGRNLAGALTLETDRFGRVVGKK